MATCGPKRILHTKIGVGTADGTVSILRAVVSGGGGGEVLFLKNSLNFYESLSVANLCSIFNSIIFH